MYERIEPKSNPHVVYSFKYYVVWCLTYQVRVFENGVDERLKPIIHQVAPEYDAELIEMEVSRSCAVARRSRSPIRQPLIGNAAQRPFFTALARG